MRWWCVRACDRSFVAGFMGCRDFCADVDVATAVGLPAHVDTSRCYLSKFLPYCLLDSCQEGFTASASSPNGTGYVHCESQLNAAHSVYEPGPVPLMCVRVPVAIAASPLDSVLLAGTTEVLAGERIVYTVELRINSSHPAIGISPHTPLAVRKPQRVHRKRPLVAFYLYSLSFNGENSVCVCVTLWCVFVASGNVIHTTLQGCLRRPMDLPRSTESGVCMPYLVGYVSASGTVTSGGGFASTSHPTWKLLDTYISTAPRGVTEFRNCSYDQCILPEHHCCPSSCISG